MTGKEAFYYTQVIRCRRNDMHTQQKVASSVLEQVLISVEWWDSVIIHDRQKITENLMELTKINKNQSIN